MLGWQNWTLHFGGKMAGKGSTPRPYSVDRKTYEDNWNRIFKKNSSVEQEIASLQRLGTNPSLAEQQDASILRDEYYDVNIDRDDSIV
jgi:hypothetical protein